MRRIQSIRTFKLSLVPIGTGPTIVAYAAIAETAAS
jgi:hypothetical protein